MTRAALIVVVAACAACGASPPTGPLPTAAGPPPAPIDAAAPVAVTVATLRAGDLVWTADAAGARVAAPIVLVRAVPIDGAREVLALTLADGRRVRASAGHPLASGGLVGAATIGTIVDGAAVTAIEPVAIRGATWDLLPAGATGAYWADDVLLGSTLVTARRWAHRPGIGSIGVL